MSLIMVQHVSISEAIVMTLEHIEIGIFKEISIRLRLQKLWIEELDYDFNFYPPYFLHF